MLQPELLAKETDFSSAVTERNSFTDYLVDLDFFSGDEIRQARFAGPIVEVDRR